MRALGCGGCHAGVPGPAGRVGPPLSASDDSRDPATLFGYLRAPPAATAAGAPRMPEFYLDEAEALALALYLGSGRGTAGADRGGFVAARRAHRDVRADDGARAFRALNCAACHEQSGVQAYMSGPPLADIAARVRPEWLREFLLRPHAVRPFGFQPGTGARMPDFRLTAGEADSIAGYLGSLGRERPADGARATSAFRAAKARTVLEQKLSCIGCHSLEGRGGRIAPDLVRVAARLQPQYVRALLAAPERAMPGIIMPRPMLPAATLESIADYLSSLRPNGDSTRSARRGYLSVVESPLLPPPAAAASGAPAEERARVSYRTRCAPCHGETGAGDGFNARHLRTRPAAHTDAARMARRPDDTLYDGIHAGAAILGGSVEMPGFGGSLAPDEIAGLVDYIRRLCDCRQPAWAGDGSTRR